MYCDINSNIGAFTDDVYRFIRSKVNSDEVAKDLTQDVLHELVISCQNSAAIKNIKSWLFAVARSTLYKYYNNHSRNVESVDITSQEFALPYDEPSTFDLEQSTISLIEKLPVDYSRILYLADIEQVKLQDIADQESLSLSAVKMRVKRGRHQLLELFKSNCDIEYDAKGRFVHCELKCC